MLLPVPISFGTRGNWRIPLGFAAAPLLPCALLSSIAYVVLGKPWGVFPVFVGMVGVCYIVTLATAVPLYVVLRRRWEISIRKCLGSGALVAVVVTVCLLLLGFVHAAHPAGSAMILRALKVTLASALLGASVGFCFWVVGIWRNPAFAGAPRETPNNRWRGP